MSAITRMMFVISWCNHENNYYKLPPKCSIQQVTNHWYHRAIAKSIGSNCHDCIGGIWWLVTRWGWFLSEQPHKVRSELFVWYHIQEEIHTVICVESFLWKNCEWKCIQRKIVGSFCSQQAWRRQRERSLASLEPEMQTSLTIVWYRSAFPNF